MAIRKKDFQRVVVDLKDFLIKLRGNDSAELRDALNFSLLHLHKYYKKLRHKTKNAPLLDGSISLTSSLTSYTPVSPFVPPVDKFDWRWINLDATKLSASFGHGDNSNLLPKIFQVIKNGDVDKLMELVEEDPDVVNEVDALGRSTLLYCIQGKSNDHMKCFDVLVQHDADLQHEANDGLTCFHLAALTDNEYVTRKLIEKQVNINTEDNGGRYPLHLAAGYSSSNIVKLLLTAGADKNCLDNEEMTPVMWSCYFDQYENVEMLLNIINDDVMKFETIDAEVQDKDLNGKNLLHWSVGKSMNKDCFKLLFTADYANIVDDSGKNVLHSIAEKGAISAIEEYFEFCGDDYMQSVDDKGHTPLHLACMNGHGEMVDILLNRGASLDAVDKQGMKPFDYAKTKNLNYCMLVILSHQKYRSESGHIESRRNEAPVEKSNTATVNEKPQNTTLLSSNSPKPPNQKISNKPMLNFQSSRPTVSRKSPDFSQFDTPQDIYVYNQQVAEKNNENTLDKPDKLKNQGPMNTSYAVGQTDNLLENDVSDEVDDVEINLNDQLIVLVEHHGSDDETMIDVDKGLNIDDMVFSDRGIDADEDHDLLDAPPFARNGSITTIGVMSEGSVAFNSVSFNPSVSSLVSSDDEIEGDQGRSRAHSPKRTPLSEPSDVSKKKTDKPKKLFKKQKSINKASPQKGVISPSITSLSNITAPIPPPSHYYQAQTNQPIPLHPPNVKPVKTLKKIKSSNHSAKEQKPHGSSTKERRSSPLSSSPLARDSSKPSTVSSSQQLSPRNQKLAPLQAIPRPPS